MKKIIIGLTLAVLVLISAIYLLIPDKLSVNIYRIIAGNSTAAYRSLVAPPANWQHWLTNHSSVSDTTYTFTTIGMFTNYNDVVINKKNGDSLHSQLRFFPIAKDSFLIEWQTNITTGFNPIKKINSYFLTKGVKAAMNNAINQFQSFIQSDEKVYGASVKKIAVVDTLLIAAYMETDSIPGNEKIYPLFNELHKTIRSQNAPIQDSGMLHITKLPSGAFKIMVAIPIQKEIQPGKNQVIKRMIPGNILVMEKTGGPYTISTAEKMLALYVTDFTMVSPAIPFQKLMTNRIAQPDTSKWVTRFYYPVY